MKRHYKAHGRRVAGTWGKPRKGNKKTAAKAVRTLQKRELHSEKRLYT